MRALWPSSKTSPEQSQPQSSLFDGKPIPTGEPLFVPLDRIDEDPDNPRTEFPDAQIDELADDIRQRGMLHAYRR